MITLQEARLGLHDAKATREQLVQAIAQLEDALYDWGTRSCGYALLGAATKVKLALPKVERALCFHEADEDTALLARKLLTVEGRMRVLGDRCIGLVPPSIGELAEHIQPVERWIKLLNQIAALI